MSHRDCILLYFDDYTGRQIYVDTSCKKDIDRWFNHAKFGERRQDSFNSIIEQIGEGVADESRFCRYRNEDTQGHEFWVIKFKSKATGNWRIYCQKLKGRPDYILIMSEFYQKKTTRIDKKTRNKFNTVNKRDYGMG